MKKLVIASLVIAMVVGMGTAYANPEGIPHGAKLIGKLNIIGMKNPKKVDLDSETGIGSVIFVSLEGHNKIGLVESGSADAPEVDPSDFAVLDKNATDGDGALFALPDPDLDAYNVDYPDGKDTDSAYSVYVRALGKPGGAASITTCAELLDSNFAGFLSGSFVRTLNKAGYFGGLASVEQVGQDILTRDKGKSTFTNVTAELLTIVFKVEVEIIIGEDALGNPIYDTIIEYIRVPIFDPIIQGEYWDYENDNLKLCQVRFYNCSTDVSEDDGTWNNEAPPEP